MRASWQPGGSQLTLRPTLHLATSRSIAALFAQPSFHEATHRSGLLSLPDRAESSSLAESAAFGDEPAVSPATRRRLVAFQLGSDVVDACCRARATVSVLAGGPRQGALSKRIGRAERVARLHNLSADVLIANVAAPVRKG